MMMRRTLKLIPFLVLLLAFVCGQRHAPAIQNTLDETVVVLVRYRNAQSSSVEEFSIFPGAKAWAPPAAIALDELEVRLGDEVLFKLVKDDLERLVSGLPPGSRVIWEIREDGVTPTVIPDE